MDNTLTALEAQRTNLLANVITKITTPQELEVVSSILAQCRTFRKAVEERRKALVKPFNDRVDAINQQVKELLQPVTNTESQATQAITEYKRLEFERYLQEIERNKADAEANFDPATSLVPEPIADLPTPTIDKVETDAGKVGFMTMWLWEVVDATLIPKDYWVLDTVKINKAVKSGTRAISGIRIYSQQTPTVRANNVRQPIS